MRRHSAWEAPMEGEGVYARSTGSNDFDNVKGQGGGREPSRRSVYEEDKNDDV